MALAIVTVAGRTYRIGCEEGQETRLVELAALLDRKIDAMRTNFGEIGDQRITVMAAIEIADEGADAHARVAALEAEVARLREETAQAGRRLATVEAEVVEALAAAEARMDLLTRTLTQDPGEGVEVPLAGEGAREGL